MGRKWRFVIRRSSFRSRVAVIAMGLAICIASLSFTTNMSRQLREKERYEVGLWATAMEQLERQGRLEKNDPLLIKIISSKNNIPFIITDGDPSHDEWHLVPDEVMNHPVLRQEKIREFQMYGGQIEIRKWDGSGKYIFYGQSSLQKKLLYFPLIQLAVIVVFVAFGYITFSSSKQDEQNRVWIGLAKETAHQLGTPISSLMGWIEYLKTQPVDPNSVMEMNKDLVRLTQVVDRFSKIGSETILSPQNVNEIVGDSVMYFRSRVPRNVTIGYNGLSSAPLRAELNPALFEWVVENLLKNALDAMQGKGAIDVKISDDDNRIYIDVSDTGKGIPKANFKRIFQPGFTTKTRGWGLGLSLSKRIVEEYHNGRIWVTESELGKGTTIRISLDKIYD